MDIPREVSNLLAAPNEKVVYSAGEGIYATNKRLIICGLPRVGIAYYQYKDMANVSMVEGIFSTSIKIKFKKSTSHEMNLGDLGKRDAENLVRLINDKISKKKKV